MSTSQEKKYHLESANELIEDGFHSVARFSEIFTSDVGITEVNLNAKDARLIQSQFVTSTAQNWMTPQALFCLEVNTGSVGS